mgnify:CR=1 FL=1
MSLFKIINEHSFSFEESVYPINEIKNIGYTKVMHIGNTTDFSLTFVVIMDDGKKLKDSGHNDEGLFGSEILKSKELELEYRDLDYIGINIMKLSYDSRKDKYEKFWKKNGYLPIKDGGGVDYDYLDKKGWVNMGVVDSEARLYEDKIVLKDSYPIFGNKYNDIISKDIKRIEYYKSKIKIENKYRNEEKTLTIKYDTDILPRLMTRWAIKNNIEFDI